MLKLAIFKWNIQIRLLVSVTFVIGMGYSLMLPLLGIYLSQNTALTLSQIGIVTGMAPLAAMLGGYLSGSLADTFGKKRIMILSLFISGLSTLGFLFIESFFFLVLLNFICGFSRIAFKPAAQSMLTDLVSEDQRVEVLSYDHTTFHIGFIIGLLLGSLAIKISAVYMLIGSSITFLSMFLMVLIFVKETSKKNNIKKNGTNLFKNIVSIFLTDSILPWILLGGVFLNIAFSQLNTAFPVYLSIKWGTQGTVWFFYLLLVYCVIIICLQVYFSKMLSKKSPYFSLIVSSLICKLAFSVLLIGDSLPYYILFICIYSFSDIVSIIGFQASVLSLSNEENKSTYLGALSLLSLGNFIGPTIGMVLIQEYSSNILFIFCVVVTFFSLLSFCYAFYISSRKHTSIEKMVS